MLGGYTHPAIICLCFLLLLCAADEHPLKSLRKLEVTDVPEVPSTSIDPYAKIPVGSRCPERQPFPSPPEIATSLNGITLPELCFDEEVSHFFAMGDYGGITCGDTETLGKKDPNGWTCKKNQGVYVKCADNTNDHPERGRYKFPVDAKPQQIVANQMQLRAAASKPLYALNAGDNFYFGGLDVKCNQPMDSIHPRTRLQFKHVFEDMYAGIDVPFFSVLGNHDYGGRHFNSAFDQQIAYTWAPNTTSRWIMPAFYYKQKVVYPAGNFSVEYFFVDTNKGDAKPFGADTKHNICGGFNSPSANCAKNGGPDNRMTCPRWFDNLWKEQATWLETQLNASTSDWQIIVTHFPPDQFMSSYWTRLHKRYGIDLFVASHRHTEEVHINDRRFGGLSWIVVGGGGGITSEWNPDGSKRGRDQYGFMDMTISKNELKIEAINENGEMRSMNTIAPHVGPTTLARQTNVDAPVPHDAHVYAIPTAEFLMMEENEKNNAELTEMGAAEMQQLSLEQLDQQEQEEERSLPAEGVVTDAASAVNEIVETVTSLDPEKNNSFQWYSWIIVVGVLFIASGVVVLMLSDTTCGRKRLRKNTASPSSAEDSEEF